MPEPEFRADDVMVEIHATSLSPLDSKSGIIRPVIDRVFQFDSIQEATTSLEQGRAKDKIVVKVR
jgi:NADPH:quinone reductase-like Zn-dependent oxidoreductase